MSANYFGPSAEPLQYATPCGRYWVERTATERFEVYGPDGKIVDWFVTLPDAKECAEGQAQANPVKAARRRGVRD